MDRKTLSIPDAGKLLGIGRSAAYEAARSGQLPTIKIGKRILVPIVALERFLEQAQRGRGCHAEECDETRALDRRFFKHPQATAGKNDG